MGTPCTPILHGSAAHYREAARTPVQRTRSVVEGLDESISFAGVQSLRCFLQHHQEMKFFRLLSRGSRYCHAGRRSSRGEFPRHP